LEKRKLIDGVQLKNLQQLQSCFLCWTQPLIRVIIKLL